MGKLWETLFDGGLNEYIFFLKYMIMPMALKCDNLSFEICCATTFHVMAQNMYTLHCKTNG